MNPPAKKSAEYTAITFLLCGTLYGMDIRYVKEVQSLADITPVPRTNRCIRGLSTIRSHIVLIADIMQLFDRNMSASDKTMSAVILRTSFEIGRAMANAPEFDFSIFGDKTLGILADEIDDVISFRSELIEPPPPHLSRQAQRYIEGIISLEGEPCCLLRAEVLLTGIAKETTQFTKGDIHD